MARLTTVVTVLSNNLGDGVSAIEADGTLPAGPLTMEAFNPLLDRLSPFQVTQIQIGISELRRAFSSRLVTDFKLRRVSADTLARTDVMSETARERLESGGALISVPVGPDFKGQGLVGRPDATSIDEAFKNSLAQAVARIIRLGTVASDKDYDHFDKQYQVLGKLLQEQAALFNINADHTRHHEVPVLNWCETRGPKLLADAYGLDERELERELDRAFRVRLMKRPFETVLGDELDLVDALIAWSGAHVERKKGVASRRDTTRRLLREHDLDWETAPGAIDPPRMHAKVRRNIVAEAGMKALSTHAMLEAALLFDLEPAYSVFLTRLYALPILAIAGLAGRTALRGQDAEITSPISAGGLIALAENLQGANDIDALTIEDNAEDEIGTLQALVFETFRRADFSAIDLADQGHEFLDTEQPITITPPTRARIFFLFP